MRRALMFLFLTGCAHQLAPGETRCRTSGIALPAGYGSVNVANTRCETGQPDPQQQIARERAIRSMVAGGMSEEQAAQVLDGR